MEQRTPASIPRDQVRPTRELVVLVRPLLRHFAVAFRPNGRQQRGVGGPPYAWPGPMLARKTHEPWVPGQEPADLGLLVHWE